MPDEKAVKKEFKLKAQKEPEKHYPVEVLKEEGFKRQICRKCGTFFWSVLEREICGDAACTGGYTFIGNSPAKKKMDFIKVWKEFSKLFKKLGYTPIKRYPVIARWREDAYFVQASIYDFQPYCVRGEIEPPANPLVVPQFCLRFNDIDNVGFTGRHYTGFVMIGQHAFEKKENYKPNDYLRHIYAWLTRGMLLPKEEIQFHEDAWAGGGNLGPSMEFFSGGLEIGNQVYMQYEIANSSLKELEIKVLDMGMGQERPAWFTMATSTSYEANFGDVIEKLYRKTGIRKKEEIVNKFLPFSGILNFEEVENIDQAWQKIANSIGVEVKNLKEEVVPLARLYALADHARSLLFAIGDGALPSNVGGGYNLRTLLRRALDFIEIYSWDVSLFDVLSWHAGYLKPQYPEVSENLDEIEKILEAEQEKYKETKARQIVASLKERRKGINLEKLIELYDSNGITPEALKNSGMDIELPADFYARVSALHEKVEREEKEEVLSPFDLKGLEKEKTEALYYSDMLNFDAKILKVLNSYLVLDRTAFYPKGGGQEYDKGVIRSEGKEARVVAVYKKDNLVLHQVDFPLFGEGEKVKGFIDKARRAQLTKHHTATHIINGSARAMLGEHIWQSGAEKTEEKARLDITHYSSLSLEEIEELEKRANEIVRKALQITHKIYSRDEAEKRFGFRIYQGGAVPGKELRIISIAKEIDVEACGGTHLKNTKDAELIRVISSSKIQDGVVRLEFCAGEACLKYLKNELESFKSALQEIKKEAKTEEVEELGREAEKAIEAQEKEKLINQKRLETFQKVSGEMRSASEVFSTSREELAKTVKRFVTEIALLRNENLSLNGELWKSVKKEFSNLESACTEIFELWKALRRENEKLREIKVKEELEFKAEEIGKIKFIFAELKNTRKELANIASKISEKCDAAVLLSLEENGTAIAVLTKNEEIDAREIIGIVAKILEGKGGGKKDFAQGFAARKEKEKIEEAKSAVREYIQKLRPV